MKSEPLPTLIPARTHEADEEQRLREAINRLCGQALAALDAAIKLGTAPHKTQRARRLPRGQQAGSFQVLPGAEPFGAQFGLFGLGCGAQSGVQLCLSGF